MNLRTSGDSVIRLLIKRFSLQPEVECGSIIGLDDFVFKKRHTYGTIIVDEATHYLVAILDGRDGNILKEWLCKNKHEIAVTIDRISAYSFFEESGCRELFCSLIPFRNGCLKIP